MVLALVASEAEAAVGSTKEREREEMRTSRPVLARMRMAIVEADEIRANTSESVALCVCVGNGSLHSDSDIDIDSIVPRKQQTALAVDHLQVAPLIYETHQSAFCSARLSDSRAYTHTRTSWRWGFGRVTRDIGDDAVLDDDRRVNDNALRISRQQHVP